MSEDGFKFIKKVEAKTLEEKIERNEIKQLKKDLDLGNEVVVITSIDEAREAVRQVRERLKNDRNPAFRSRDQLEKDTMMILARLYSIWQKDLKTMMPDGTILTSSSANGLIRQSVSGLSGADRTYLMQSMNMAKTMLEVFLNKDNELEAKKEKDALQVFAKNFKGFKVATPEKMEKVKKAQEDELNAIENPEE